MLSIVRKSVCVLVCIVALGAFADNACAGDVLILGDGNADAVVEGILTAAGHNVTIAPLPEFDYDGTNPSLSSFCAVVHLNGDTFNVGMLQAGQIALQDYVVNGGGGFVGMEWNAFEEQVYATMLDMPELVLMTRTQSAEGPHNYTLTTEGLSHPVTAGLPATFPLSAWTNEGPCKSAVGMLTLATHDADIGGAAVCAIETGLGRVVNFAHAGNYGGFTPFADANVAQLLTQSVNWACNLQSWVPETVLVWSTGNADGNTPGVAAYIQAAGGFTTVDALDQDATVPLAQLSQYDAVVYFSSSSFSQDPVAIGDVLADYADTGRCLTLATFSWANQGNNTLAGRIITEEISPFVFQGPSLYSTVSMAWNDGSPLFNGVTSVDASYHDDVVLTTDAVQRATWDDNSPMVASKANVFGVNYFPDDSYGSISGDYDQLLANTVSKCSIPAAPVSEYYLLDGNSRQISVVRNGVLQRSWTAPDDQLPVAVSDTVRTYGEYGDGGDYGSEYQLDGTPTGTTYPWQGLATEYLVDGTTDGTTYNWLVGYDSNQVIQYDRDWANPTVLFTTPAEPTGITYDPTTGHLGHLWLIVYSTATINEYTMAGTLVSSFPYVYSGWMGALAYEPATDTLWAAAYLSGGELWQYDKTGNVLQKVTVPAVDGYVWGGEFAIGGGADLIFADGFESGSTSAWSATVP